VGVNVNEFEALLGWPEMLVGERLAGGHRNDVWSAQLDGERVVVRRSKRRAESLNWELDLLVLLPSLGINVAEPIATRDGSFTSGGYVVQRWVDGREPSSKQDWQAVGDALKHVHSVAANLGQRPGCCVVTDLRNHRVSVDADINVLPSGARELVLSVFESFNDAPVSLIHGDPGAPNLRIGDAGEVTFLDWDESRVDVVWHDLSNLGVQVLDDESHARSVRLSNAWETVNAWTTEPEYARQRLAALG
jgi:aminoglycoside phosphotransferase (APT) family kinase protein